MKNKMPNINGGKKISDSSTDNENNDSPDRFPIVGIGASAGGFEALEDFFKDMPSTCGMAFVVIQHLDPNYKGVLAELLQRTTSMQVFTASDKLKIEPNCIYVKPSNKSMSILNRELFLFDPLDSGGLQQPIDEFFMALAEDQRDKSIGIILSGLGADGCEGVKLIKKKSGLVLVQDPEQAKFNGMPQSAINNVDVDVIATSKLLPLKLLELTQYNQRFLVEKELEKDTSSLDKIIILLRSKTGNDFSQYKNNTLYRRIERRMNIHQIKSIQLYVKYLQENPVELEILFKELLICVTSFFRDPKVWIEFKAKIIQMLLHVNDKQTFRAWVSACSTGEEAYSLAIIFKEATEELNLQNRITIKIFATDLDTTAIVKARKGAFPESIESDVSVERLNRFFVKEKDQYIVKSEIRDMVVFAQQNIIKDPPFIKLDIITCRNMLIYMDADLQNKIMKLFHYSLNSNGLLLLGSAETPGNHSDLFTIVDSKSRIYQRSGTLKGNDFLNFPSSYSSQNIDKKENITQVKISENIQTLTDKLLLQQFSPVSLLVTDKGDILYITGSTGKYLEPAAGKANMNIFAMAREGLRAVLPDAFRKAVQTSEKVVLTNLKVGVNDNIQYVNILIQQIQQPKQLYGKIIVIFEDVPSIELDVTNKKKNKIKSNLYKTALELELQHTKVELLTTREEMLSSQEELQSINEELQSTNEELQSTNEEIITSKEEMQSLNEELQSVNSELKVKIDDNLRVINDLNNLLNSIDSATLFLDREFKIRQFTHQTTKIFKLIPTDIGRLFTDLANDLVYPELFDDARKVLRTLVFIEKEVPTKDDRWFNIRIMPYRTIEDKINGLVITFIDITAAKLREITLNDILVNRHLLIEAIPSVSISISKTGEIIEFNSAAEEFFECKKSEVINKNYFNLFIPEIIRNDVELKMKKLFVGALPDSFENVVKTKDGSEIDVKWSVHKLFNNSGKRLGITIIATNLTRK